jgi:hypothetical protein
MPNRIEGKGEKDVAILLSLPSTQLLPLYPNVYRWSRKIVSHVLISHEQSPGPAAR